MRIAKILQVTSNGNMETSLLKIVKVAHDDLIFGVLLLLKLNNIKNKFQLCINTHSRKAANEIH